MPDKTITKKLAGKKEGRHTAHRDGSHTLTLPEAHFEALRQAWVVFFDNNEHSGEVHKLDALMRGV